MKTARQWAEETRAMMQLCSAEHVEVRAMEKQFAAAMEQARLAGIEEGRDRAERPLKYYD